jgi:hypothetical protein
MILKWNNICYSKKASVKTPLNFLTMSKFTICENNEIPNFWNNRHQICSMQNYWKASQFKSLKEEEKHRP